MKDVDTRRFAEHEANVFGADDDDDVETDEIIEEANSLETEEAGVDQELGEIVEFE